MNINTTSNSTSKVASSSDVTSSKSTSKTENTEKSEKSFEDEMKNASKTEDKNENKNEKVDSDKKTEEIDSNKEANNIKEDLDKSDNIVPEKILTGEVNFTDFKYHNESQSILSKNIQSLINTKDLMNVIGSATHFEYDAINMSEDDANFFADLVQNTDMSMKSIANQINDAMVKNVEGTQKSVQVSSVLMEKLAESMKTNKPFRIDFDKDVSVIIRVNKDGSLAANFIPGDKAVEQYLRNNISLLKQRFDEQDLQYSELSYSNSRQQQKQKQKNKEN